MAQVRQDNVQIKLEIDGSQSRTELDNLTRKAQVLQDGLKGMKRGTDEYIAANKELSQVNKRIGELREEIGLTGLTITQLGKLSKQLTRELNGLVPGTEAFIAKSQELTTVDERLAQVRREARGVKDELDAAGGGFGDFLKKAVAFTGIQLGLEAVLGGLKQLGSESIDEFAQAQGAAAQLEASLNSTGHAAGLTKQELLDLSTALEGKTILDGDAITQAQSVLLTFTKIKKGVYEEALPAILDMATKLGGDGEADLKGATIQVGKALNDPIKGIAALGKAGVSFSEDQKTMIKTLVETGDVAGAQAIILGELKTEFAGSAEAAAKAGTGPLKQFQIQIGNVKEGLGELIVDGLQAIQPVLAAGVSLFAFFIELLKGTPAFISENKAALVGLGVAIVTLNAEQLILNGLVLYQAVIEKGRAAATIASAAAQRLLNGAMMANPIGLVIAAVALLVGGFITLYERSEKVREAFAGLGVGAVQVFKNIKEAFLLNLAGLSDVLVGIFTADPNRIKKGLEELGSSIKKTYTGLGDGVAGAYHQGYTERENLENLAAELREKGRSAAKIKKAQEAAKKTAEEELKANLEGLKNREANIKAALALVAAGSAEELRLKKLEITTKRDIDLLGEKKTAGDKKVIVAEALRDIRQLQDDYDKKGQAAAEKRTKEKADAAKKEVDVEQKIAEQRAAGIADETERKIVLLQLAAEKEKRAAIGTVVQIAEQKLLIEQKLAREIADVRQTAAAKAAKEAKDEADKRQKEAVERLKKERELAERILAIDADIALRRIDRRRQESAEFSAARAQADTDELAVRKQRLDAQYADEYFQQGLSNTEKLAISRRYLDEKDALEEEYSQRAKGRNQAGAEFALGVASQAVQTLSDFSKIDSDKELVRIEQSKKKRLAQLDTEYKAGRVAKESYESQKSAIEANYDAQTRRVKKDAAEKEKAYNVAQAIIAGTLSVIKLLDKPPLAIAAGIAAALGVAKIIATPIPEFAKGGVIGGPSGATWRDRVRHFASGGINPVAGVPSVGQLHSGGGIRMVDGATGQHLGEWERGEPYMILSRDTYANNRELVDDLLDTSMNRGGASVRRRDGGYYAEGGTPGGALPAAGGALPAAGGAASSAGSQELVQAVNRVESAVRALPSRQYIAWTPDDTANVEDALNDRQDVRESNSIR